MDPDPWGEWYAKLGDPGQTINKPQPEPEPDYAPLGWALMGAATAALAFAAAMAVLA